MKKLHFALLALIFSQATFAQFDLEKIKTKVKSTVSTVSGDKNGSSLSSDEIISGLKEALTKGTDNSTKILHQADGYFGNAAIKILMPAEAQKVESTLRNLGMSSLVDKAILSMNRAAEDAAGGVSTIFFDAIKKMTVKDGLSILRGGNFAATDYLKQTTTSELTAMMKPIIDASLQKVNATAYWDKVFSNYNRFSSNKVETDLSAWVTAKALKGMFVSIGQEEQKIRQDPAARTTDLLKKVFNK